MRAWIAKATLQLQILFPLSDKVICPEIDCNTSYVGHPWSSANNSIKHHLRTKHCILIESSVFWCFVCQQRIHCSPAEHACLQGQTVTTSQAADEFRRDRCSFSCATQVGLNHHLKSHGRNDAKANEHGRNLPGASRQRRATPTECAQI
ncbi:hypothetical protein AVEN_243072-1 [Araneus ventricosus]|uniref:C2H2-type domain-containing protein n=1 Tax=Araneus ventricosus TaxID=182803 RepID=A0A4Y2U5T1_ARAVE|nr:hypothetical protein AVEN_243072-1 [Araneus ventricosus]